MGIIAGILIVLLLICPSAFAQLQGEVEERNSSQLRSGIGASDSTRGLSPRYPTAEDLQPIRGRTDDQQPIDSGTKVWSMQIANTGQNYVVNVSPVSGTSTRELARETFDPKWTQDWNSWTARILHEAYADCSQFKCRSDVGDVCTVHIRSDGAVHVFIPNGRNEASTLFENAMMRLQGNSVLKFPPGSQREQVSFAVNVHFGAPPQPLMRDAFGTPNPRFPVKQWAW